MISYSKAVVVGRLGCVIVFLSFSIMGITINLRFWSWGFRFALLEWAVGGGVQYTVIAAWFEGWVTVTI